MKQIHRYLPLPLIVNYANFPSFHFGFNSASECVFSLLFDLSLKFSGGNIFKVPTRRNFHKERLFPSDQQNKTYHSTPYTAPDIKYTVIFKMNVRFNPLLAPIERKEKNVSKLLLLTNDKKK